MRKSLLAILLVVYTTVCAVGMPLTIYYCDGAFTGIGWEQQQDCCPVDDGCCETEYTVIKADTEHATPSQLKYASPLCKLLPADNGFGFLFTATPLNSQGSLFSFRSKSPPPPDIPILFSTFRI